MIIDITKERKKERKKEKYARPSLLDASLTSDTKSW
jgi:hypothetical protein